MRKIIAIVALLTIFAMGVAIAAPSDSQRLSDVKACLDAGTGPKVTVSCVKAAMNGWVAPAPSPSPTTTTTAPPPTTTTTVTPPPTTTTTTATPPPSGDIVEFASVGHGRFRLGCGFSHREQVDPIVAPGATSGHMHDFFGNESTNRFSTYETMIAAATNCDTPLDTAGYWAPTLIAPDGTMVDPIRQQIYYRNRPYKEGPLALTPPDLRIIAGGPAANLGKPYPVTYWNCDGESDGGLSTRYVTVPNCTGTGNGPIEAHVYFPTCWDGRTDSPDHRSHLAYPVNYNSISDSGTCPTGYPYRIQQLDIRILYPVTNGTGYHFSDGETLIHMDFWNTWNQPELRRLTRDCLAAGVNCEGL